jgi:hypothetical protein
LSTALHSKEIDPVKMTVDITKHSANLNGKREQLICLASGFLVFLISLVISSLYTGGDQVAYHSAYEIVSGLSVYDRWYDIKSIYQSWVSSGEWIHLFVSLIGGGLGIEKNLLMSVMNGVMAAYTVRLLLTWGASLWIALGLVLGNYYLYVLYFAAERLKFAFLFLVLSMLCIRRPKNFVVNSLLSIFSHFSIIFIYGGIWLSQFKKIISIKQRAGLYTLGVSLVLMMLLLARNLEYLLSKLNIYYLQAIGPFSISKFLPMAILLGFSCLYAKQNWEPLMMLSPILIGVAILDGSRLNMLGFFIFLYYGIKVKGGINVGVLSIMGYFFYKTFIFVKLIVIQGHGFGVSG